MLRILDNPYQDIPMAAVLRSPLVGLDEEEMAQIRVENPACSFAEAAMPVSYTHLGVRCKL